MDKFFNTIIFFILSVSSVAFILEVSGFMPAGVSKWLNRNKLSQTIDLLKELGVDVEKNRRTLLVSNVPRYFNSSEIENSLRNLLETATIAETVGIGKIETATSKAYIDVMGHSTNPQIAELYARYLSTYWSNILKDPLSVKNVHFDFIVTPKLGSPILGYEFSKILNKPFALYIDEHKFQTKKDIFQKCFDFSGKKLATGSIALLVDDSTTGGRKMINAIRALRQQGYTVTDCLVLFEPTIKDARERLKDENVMLHSILKV